MSRVLRLPLTAAPNYLIILFKQEREAYGLPKLSVFRQSICRVPAISGTPAAFNTVGVAQIGIDGGQPDRLRGGVQAAVAGARQPDGVTQRRELRACSLQVQSPRQDCRSGRLHSQHFDGDRNGLHRTSYTDDCLWSD